MEAIRRIVSEIIFLCRNKDMPVSDTLAAFVAHSLVLERADLFPLDKELSEGDVQTLVRMTVERLLTTDSPSLETIKMQVAFDSAKLEEVDVLDRQRNSREAREAVMLRDIIDVRLKGANDVPALTALYKRIFNFLVLRAALDPGVNRPAEREIAAALESVFPRIGLKAFTLLAPEDKAAQLHELANIVLGIRLYNRSIGKGGAGIDDLPALARAAVQELARACGGALENIDKLAAEYGEVMSYRHSAVRMRAVGALTAAEQADDAAKTQRLHDELANRRQYGAYTATLFDGLQTSSKHLAEIERLQEKVRAGRAGLGADGGQRCGEGEGATSARARRCSGRTRRAAARVGARPLCDDTLSRQLDRSAHTHTRTPTHAHARTHARTHSGRCSCRRASTLALASALRSPLALL